MMGVWNAIGGVRTMVAAALWAGAVVCSPALGQGVRLVPVLEKGKTLTYEVSRSLRVEQTAADAAAAPPAPPAGEAGKDAAGPSVSESTLDMVLRLDVGSVRADGTTEVGVQIQSLKIRLSDGGPPPAGSTERVFTHPAENGVPEMDAAEMAAAAAKAKDDAKEKPPSALEMVGTALAASSPRVVINREGGVSEILGLDNLAMAVESAKKSDRSVSHVVIESIGPWALRQALMPVFAPASPEPASRRFAPGDTWTVRQTRDLGSIGSVVIDEGWTMSGEAGGTVTASGGVKVTAEGPRGIVSASPSIKVESSSGSHELAWDVSGGALAKFSRGVEMVTVFSLGDIAVRQRQVSLLVVSRP